MDIDWELALASLWPLLIALAMGLVVRQVLLLVARRARLAAHLVPDRHGNRRAGGLRAAAAVPEHGRERHRAARGVDGRDPALAGHWRDRRDHLGAGARS